MLGDLKSLESTSNSYEGVAYIPLRRLAYLLDGDICLNQFELNRNKVINFLFDKTIGLVETKKLLNPIVVGIVDESLEDPELPSEVFSNDEPSSNTFTVGGRHRIVGLLTWAAQHSEHEGFLLETPIPCYIRRYRSWEEAALAVFADNASRSMTPTEKLNVRTQSKAVDTASVLDLAYYSTNACTSKEAFVLLVSYEYEGFVLEHGGVPLTRNTVATIAKAFISKFPKRILTWFSNPQTIVSVSTILNHALLDNKHLLVGNVARNATTIGRALFSIVEESILNNESLEPPTGQTNHDNHEQPTVSQQTVEQGIGSGLDDQF